MAEARILWYIWESRYCIAEAHVGRGFLINATKESRELRLTIFSLNKLRACYKLKFSSPDGVNLEIFKVYTIRLQRYRD